MRFEHQLVAEKQAAHLLERSATIAHVRAAGVRWPSLLSIIHLSGLLEDKVSVSVVTVPFRQHQREEQVKDDLAVVNRVSGHICHEPMPKLGERAISTRVDVQIAEHNCVQAVRLRWPLEHRFEPGHICRETHAGEGTYGLVRQIEGIARGMVDDVRNDLQVEKVRVNRWATVRRWPHLVAHEDILEEISQQEVGLAGPKRLRW